MPIPHYLPRFVRMRMIEEMESSGGDTANVDAAVAAYLVANPPSAQSVYGFAKRSSTSTANAAPRLTIPWDTDTQSLGSGITWNALTPTRLTVTEAGTYRLGAVVTFVTTQQRGQAVLEVRVNGTPTGIFRGSSYARNAGTSWDFWAIEMAGEPMNLSAADYVELDLVRTSGANANYATGGSGTITLRGQSSLIWLERVA